MNPKMVSLVIASTPYEEYQTWINFTPPKIQHFILIFWNMEYSLEYATEYSTKYSMKYENQKMEYSRKMAKKQKYRFFIEKWQNSKNVDFFGIWNIPGIFRKNGKTAKMSIFLEYGIFWKIRNSPVKRHF